MADFECNDFEKNCPFRVIDISKNVAICKFYKKYWEAYDNNPVDALNLTKKACDGIRQYELYRKHLVEITERRTIKMLKNVNVGDKLYWLIHSEDVILVEKPTKLSTITRCTCQRDNKEIIEIPAHLLRKISKGNYNQDHNIYGTDKTNEARILELTAREAGFRVELEKLKNGIRLKFYGDSQEEVDDFVNLVAKDNFLLF